MTPVPLSSSSTITSWGGSMLIPKYWAAAAWELSVNELLIPWGSACFLFTLYYWFGFSKSILTSSTTISWMTSSGCSDWPAAPAAEARENIILLSSSGWVDLVLLWFPFLIAYIWACWDYPPSCFDGMLIPTRNEFVAFPILCVPPVVAVAVEALLVRLFFPKFYSFIIIYNL